MYYNIKRLLAIEKELARPENSYEDEEKGAINIRDYDDCVTQKVTDFTPAQSWYIQQHLDFINDLYSKDYKVYQEVPQLSSSAPFDFPEVPKYSLHDKCEFTRLK